MNRFSVARTITLGVVILYFLAGGIAHFVLTDFFIGIVPPWIPAPVLVVFVSGAFEILGALGLLWPRSRRPSGIFLMLLTIAVTPANVHMLLNASDYSGIPYWALVIRLPLQLALLALIAWAADVASLWR